MHSDILSDNLGKFYDEIDERLEHLQPAQQQQYLEGLVHAFDSVTRYANPAEVTPYERENFVSSALCYAYSRTQDLGLDPETRMRPLIESGAEHVRRSFEFVTQAHKVLGIPIALIEELPEILAKFYGEIDERLERLQPSQQQQYLEGLVHAFDSITRYANPAEVTPFGREDFIGSAKSCAYSKTHHLGLDAETRMRPLIESGAEEVFRSYQFAQLLHEELDMPLDTNQKMRLMNIAFVFGLECSPESMNAKAPSRFLGNRKSLPLI